MVDLAPLFSLAEQLARQAITTAGTTVRFETRTDNIDPTTLTRSATATVLTRAPAIVTTVGVISATHPLGPGVQMRDGDYRIVLEPDVSPPPVMSWMVVETCRDPNLTGHEGQVLGHVVNSAGAVLIVFARPA